MTGTMSVLRVGDVGIILDDLKRLAEFHNYRYEKTGKGVPFTEGNDDPPKVVGECHRFHVERDTLFCCFDANLSSEIMRDRSEILQVALIGGTPPVSADSPSIVEGEGS